MNITKISRYVLVIEDNEKTISFLENRLHDVLKLTFVSTIEEVRNEFYEHSSDHFGMIVVGEKLIYDTEILFLVEEIRFLSKANLVIISDKNNTDKILEKIENISIYSKEKFVQIIADLSCSI